MKSIVVFGCGGHGKVVADAALAAGFRVLGFGDDNPALRGRATLGLATIAIGIEETAAFCTAHSAALVFGIGDNQRRASTFERALELGVRAATVVHPSAVIAPSVELGPGTVVFAGVVINPDSRVAENVIVNTAVSLDHDNVIGAHAHISPGAVLGGTVSVGEGTHLGIGATVRNNVRIGAWSVIGAGAVVVRDVPDAVVSYGVPARAVRRLERH